VGLLVVGHRDRTGLGAPLDSVKERGRGSAICLLSRMIYGTQRLHILIPVSTRFAMIKRCRSK
jgi:hypothetical protein